MKNHVPTTISEVALIMPQTVNKVGHELHGKHPSSTNESNIADPLNSLVLLRIKISRLWMEWLVSV
jgi:hypothetical protein